MSTHEPDLDSLLDEHITGSERDRLARVHDRLLYAGPLPELPDSLSQPPRVALRRLPLAKPARSRRHLLVAAAATLALAAAALTYSLSGHTPNGPEHAVTMHATAAAPNAEATLRIDHPDAAGNRPLTLRIRGLPPPPAGGHYEMYLTSNGRIIAPCGSFTTRPGTTTVRLNVPYRLSEYSGWLIRLEQPHRKHGPTLLTT